MQDFFHQSSTNFTRSTEIKLSLMSHCIFPATLKAKSDGRTVRHARSSSIESQYLACRSRRIRPPFSVPNQFEFVWEKRRGPTIKSLKKKWNRRLRWRVIGSALDKPQPPDWPLRTQSLGSFRVRSFAFFFVPPRGWKLGRERVEVMTCQEDSGINGFNLHQIAPCWWK